MQCSLPLRLSILVQSYVNKLRADAVPTNTARPTVVIRQLRVETPLWHTRAMCATS